MIPERGGSRGIALRYRAPRRRAVAVFMKRNGPAVPRDRGADPIET